MNLTIRLDIKIIINLKFFLSLTITVRVLNQVQSFGGSQ